jgi:hypothetical protein
VRLLKDVPDPTARATACPKLYAASGRDSASRYSRHEPVTFAGATIDETAWRELSQRYRAMGASTQQTQLAREREATLATPSGK